MAAHRALRLPRGVQVDGIGIVPDRVVKIGPAVVVGAAEHVIRRDAAAFPDADGGAAANQYRMFRTRHIFPQKGHQLRQGAAGL